MTEGGGRVPPPLPRDRRVDSETTQHQLSGQRPEEVMANAPRRRPVSDVSVQASRGGDLVARDRSPAASWSSKSKTGAGPAVIAGVALLMVAGVLGWYLSGAATGDDIEAGGDASGRIEADVAVSDGQDVEEPVALAPMALPTADEPGVVGLELPLSDPYTGTGSTGAVQIYINSLSGQVCHQFEAPAMTGRYRAYLHQAPFPQEGPVVLDLGEVANSVPLCVAANPIDLARTLADGEGFYVAAHGTEKTFIMRGQMSLATVTFDNRDPATVASQEAAINRTTTTIGDGSADDLFGLPEEGAYLLVDAGRVSFEGMVPDVATADRLRSAFIPLLGRGVQVTDNLEIQAGAPPPSGRVIVAGALLFESGQDSVSGETEVLPTLVDLMTVNPTWTMTITGHTDNIGDWLANIELSLRRANNVRTRLAQLGIPQERLRVQGAGPEQPIADNQTEEGRAINRRIEISIDS